MVTYRKKIKKKLKSRTYKKNNRKTYKKQFGGNPTTQEMNKTPMPNLSDVANISPFMRVVNSVRDIINYSFWSFMTMPVYFTTVALNTPFNSIRNITNSRLKDVHLVNKPIYKLFSTNNFTKEQLQILENNIKEGKIVYPAGYSYYDGYLTKGGIMKGGANPLLQQMPNLTRKANPTQSKGTIINNINSMQQLATQPNLKLENNPQLKSSLSWITGKRLNDVEETQFQKYNKERFTKTTKNENFLNSLKNFLNVKSLDVYDRNYNVYGKSTLKSISEMPYLDQDREKQLELYMKKLNSKILLKAIIIFKTIFDSQDNDNNNVKCRRYLDSEKRKMGFNETEPIPTYFNPEPIRKIKNPFKYKNTLNYKQLTTKNFARCLKATLTQKEFTDEDIELCFDTNEVKCKDCTLQNNFMETLKKIPSMINSSNGIKLNLMIESLFSILIELNKNEPYETLKKSGDDKKKYYETELVESYFKNFYDLNSLSTRKLVHYVPPSPTENGIPIQFIDFIGKEEIKMFKDLMCKYKLYEKLKVLYKEKRIEELELIKRKKNEKNGKDEKDNNEYEKAILDDLFEFMEVYMDKETVNKIRLSNKESQNDRETQHIDLKKIRELFQKYEPNLGEVGEYENYEKNLINPNITNTTNFSNYPANENELQDLMNKHKINNQIELQKPTQQPTPQVKTIGNPSGYFSTKLPKTSKFATNAASAYKKVRTVMPSAQLVSSIIKTVGTL